MRILQFITSLRPGGAERLVTDLSLRFHEAGHEVSVLLLDGTRTPFYEELERGGIAVTALSEGFKSMRNPFLLFKLVRFLKAGRFDIAHTHNTSCQFLAAAASLFVRVRLVTTEHNVSNRRRKWSWFKPFDRWMYSRYSRIICVGERTRRNLIGFLGDAVSDKSVVIPNGVDLRRFSEAVPDKDISAYPGHKLIMVAAFRAQKDQATLVKAMADLPEDYRLFLVGGVELPEDEPNLENCKTLVADLDLGKKVYFLGKRSDVPSLLAAADVVVLSTHYEGMSLSVIEGMASGKPFIASDVSGVREQVGNAGALFPESDSKSLAMLIKSLCENPALADEVAGKCLSKASEHDLETMVTKHIELYACFFTN